MNIILFGFRKCGKTYYGMKLAQKFHREFIESDHLLEEFYALHHHEPLSYREIVKKHGFAFFCDLEKHVVSQLVQKKNYVLSLGGGVVLDPENIARLKETGILIYLKVSQEFLKTRILSGDIPQYLNPESPCESFEAFYQERDPLYAKAASHQVDTTDKTEEQIFAELCHLVKEHVLKKGT